MTYLGAAFAVARLGQMDYETYDVVHGLGAVRALRRLERAAVAGADPSGDRAIVGARRRPGPTLVPVPSAVGGAALDLSGPPALGVDGLRFRYGPGKCEVLRGLSLSVPPRAVLAIVGANGIGKTTFIKLLAGLHEPTGGVISAGGLRLGEQLPVGEWRRRMTGSASPKCPS